MGDETRAVVHRREAPVAVLVHLRRIVAQEHFPPAAGVGQLVYGGRKHVRHASQVGGVDLDRRIVKPVRELHPGVALVDLAGVRTLVVVRARQHDVCRLRAKAASKAHTHVTDDTGVHAQDIQSDKHHLLPAVAKRQPAGIERIVDGYRHVVRPVAAKGGADVRRNVRPKPCRLQGYVRDRDCAVREELLHGLCIPAAEYALRRRVEMQAVAAVGKPVRTHYAHPADPRRGKVDLLVHRPPMPKTHLSPVRSFPYIVIEESPHFPRYERHVSELLPQRRYENGQPVCIRLCIPLLD